MAKVNDSMPTPRLITIPVSHFCEKARWALDHAGIPFQEEGHLPMLHRIAVKRAGGKQSVPVLVKQGGILGESTDIVRWADSVRTRGARLWPADHDAEIAAWVKRFDTELGPATRLLGYAALLPRIDLMADITTGIPTWEARLVRVGFPVLARILRKKLAITPEREVKAMARIQRSFDAVAAVLANGQRYLVGDSFTAADLTFAAMAAPSVFPAHYAGPLPSLDKLAPDHRKQVEAWRSHPAGAFALRMFSEHRRQ